MWVKTLRQGPVAHWMRPDGRGKQTVCGVISRGWTPARKRLPRCRTCWEQRNES